MLCPAFDEKSKLTVSCYSFTPKRRCASLYTCDESEKQHRLIAHLIQVKVSLIQTTKKSYSNSTKKVSAENKKQRFKSKFTNQESS